MKNHTSIHQFQSIHEPFWLNHSCTQLPNLTCYHYHDGCEIYLFLQGNAVMYVESQAFPLERGDLFVFGPDELQEVLFLLRRLENNLHSTSYGDDLLTSFALTELPDLLSLCSYCFT